MPYIPETDRDELVLDRRSPKKAGELNYLITQIVDEYVYTNGGAYTAINTAIGALECAKLELYRRVAAPHEDQKCFENGDVYLAAQQP